MGGWLARRVYRHCSMIPVRVDWQEVLMIAWNFRVTVDTFTKGAQA